MCIYNKTLPLCACPASTLREDQKSRIEKNLIRVLMVSESWHNYVHVM